ncbi:hypothetical protein COOONC_25239, partial [Cooperia oncophora]
MIFWPLQDDASELSDYLAYVVFVLYHLSSYSTSLIEEEHDIWYYVSSTLILHKMATIVRTPEKSGYSSETRLKLRSGVALLCLHRLAMSFTSHTRRRWSMRQDVLPPPILPEFRFNVQLLDDFTTDLNLSELAKWMPFTTTVLCVGYLVARARPRNSGILVYAVSAAICLQTFLDDSKRFMIVYFIIGGVIITLLSSAPLAVILYLSYLVRPETLPLLIISFEMGVRARRVS